MENPCAPEPSEARVAMHHGDSDLVPPEVIRLPFLLESGDTCPMVTHVYKPAGDGPFPVVVFGHGRPSDHSQPNWPIPIAHANFWLKRGFAVVAPVRPGYGLTGGDDRETAFVPSTESKDQKKPREIDYALQARRAAQPLLGACEWAQKQPWARKDAILLEGQSVGGLAVTELASRNIPGVVGTINFVGGSGARSGASLFGAKSESPELVEAAFRGFGKQVATPSLWIYPPNDEAWGKSQPRKWYDAFAAGGSTSHFHQTAPVPRKAGEAHHLLKHSPDLWTEAVDRFVRGLPVSAAATQPHAQAV